MNFDDSDFGGKPGGVYNLGFGSTVGTNRYGGDYYPYYGYNRDGSYNTRGTIVTNVGDRYLTVPPGSSVRAHVQAIDLLPLRSRARSPSEQLKVEVSQDNLVRAESRHSDKKTGSGLTKGERRFNSQRRDDNLSFSEESDDEDEGSYNSGYSDISEESSIFSNEDLPKSKVDKDCTDNPITSSNSTSSTPKPTKASTTKCKK